MDTIEFRIIKTDSQPVGEAFETRILINGKDFLESIDPTERGIYPRTLFDKQNFYQSDRLTLGICVCGCPGCCDIWTTVTVIEKSVIWQCPFSKFPEITAFTFDLQQYQEEIARASNDYRWEEKQDTIKRLLEKLDYSHCTQEGFQFTQTSTSEDLQEVTLAFSREDQTYLLTIPWKNATPEDVEAKAQHIIENFKTYKTKLKKWEPRRPRNKNQEQKS